MSSDRFFVQHELTLTCFLRFAKKRSAGHGLGPYCDEPSRRPAPYCRSGMVFKSGDDGFSTMDEWLLLKLPMLLIRADHASKTAVSEHPGQSAETGVLWYHR